MISLDLMKSSEVRKAGDQSIYLKLIFKLKLITPTYPTFFFLLLRAIYDTIAEQLRAHVRNGYIEICLA